MSHYNGKKELLLQSQEEVAELRRSVQRREEELQAAATRHQLLQLEVEQVRSSEKKLLGSVASLEAQVSRSRSRFSRSPHLTPVSSSPCCCCCPPPSWPLPIAACELTPGSRPPRRRPTWSCLEGAPASSPHSGHRRRRA